PGFVSELARLRHGMECPHELAGKNVIGSNVTRRGHVAFTGRAAQNEEILKRRPPWGMRRFLGECRGLLGQCRNFWGNAVYFRGNAEISGGTQCTFGGTQKFLGERSVLSGERRNFW